MSDIDIRKAIQSGEMAIAPFNIDKTDERLTPAGFNFSFTNFIISLNERKPYEVLEEQVDENESVSNVYFELKPGDSALALTRESIWVSGSIAGTFHSKVAYAALGLGQISTTLDPGWQGQLLISMNNPNASPVKVVIANRDKCGQLCYKNFITLCLYRLESPTKSKSDNVYARLEIIENVLKQNRPRGEDIQILLDEISKLKSTIEIQRQKKNLNLGIEKASEGALKDFAKIHDIMLKELEKIAPPVTGKEASTHILIGGTNS